MSGDVRFVRIRGRIVPIRSKPKRSNTTNTGVLALSAMAGGEGASLIKKGADQATGVSRYYHGTSKQSAASIRKTGLTGKFAMGEKAVFRGESYARNKGLAFVTPDKQMAKMYSRVAAYTAKGGVLDPAKAVEYKNKLNIAMANPLNRGSILSFKMSPGDAARRLIPDPEIAEIGGMNQNFAANARRKATPFLSHRRIDGYLKGKKAAAMRVRYAKRAWKAAPGKAALGLGKMGIGATVLGASAYVGIEALHNLRKKK